VTLIVIENVKIKIFYLEQHLYLKYIYEQYLCMCIIFMYVRMYLCIHEYIFRY